jgi:serine/threonine protein kinase
MSTLVSLIFHLKDHPNILKLFETYEDQKYIYLIME